MNWPQALRLSEYVVIMGGVAYWRKHVALLKLPPDVQEALGLQASAKREDGQ